MDRRSWLRFAGAVAAWAAWPGASVRGASQLPAGVESFRIAIDEAELEALARRLASPRWPPDIPGEPWAGGTDRAYLEELVTYWRDSFDWRAQEAALNRFDQFTTEIDGQQVHFVHQRGSGGGRLPLLMTHGWPGTFWEMLPAVPALTDPLAHGGVAADAFDVVVPSIPGFGFSGPPPSGTDVFRTAELWVALMERLGYERFGAYGSDWGAGVTRAMGARFPARLLGVITAGTPPRVNREPDTDEERAYITSNDRWMAEEMGYMRIQESRPQTLAYGLTDSPIGLAAWLTEKLRLWTDSGGDVEARLSKDQILTLVSIYWHTRTIGTSARFYYAHQTGSMRSAVERAEVFASLGALAPIEVPQGWTEYLGMPGRMRAPRSYVRELPPNVTFWEVHDAGGHFPALEVPDLVVQDLRDFFRPLR